MRAQRPPGAPELGYAGRQYDEVLAHPDAAVDRPGCGPLAFQVSNVGAAVDVVLAAGGGRVGQIVTLLTADGRQVAWCYTTDPEGNIVELQAWSG